MQHPRVPCVVHPRQASALPPRCRPWRYHVVRFAVVARTGTCQVRRRRGQVCCRHRIRLEKFGHCLHHRHQPPPPQTLLDWIRPSLLFCPRRVPFNQGRLRDRAYETRRQNHRQLPFSSNVSPPYRNQGNTHPRRVHVPRLTTRRKKPKLRPDLLQRWNMLNLTLGQKRRRHYPRKEISIDRCGGRVGVLCQWRNQMFPRQRRLGKRTLGNLQLGVENAVRRLRHDEARRRMGRYPLTSPQGVDSGVFRARNF